MKSIIWTLFNLKDDDANKILVKVFHIKNI